MANDITKAISANPLKNGTLLVQCKATGFSVSDINDKYVKNTPTITDIENKYDDRFDDPSYYHGIGQSEVIGV